MVALQKTGGVGHASLGIDYGGRDSLARLKLRRLNFSLTGYKMEAGASLAN